MTRKKKIWIGIFTIAPIAMLLLYVFGLLIFGAMIALGFFNEDSIAMFVSFGVLAAIMFIAAGMATFIWIYLLVHASGNKKFNNDDRMVWILVIALTHLVGTIIYWYMHIWKDNSESEL